MKKTLLSVLAGLAVMGSASAAPTVEDRKALCDILIQKGTHVWVEKTEACIPVDPCGNGVNDTIRSAYCLTDLGERFVFRGVDGLADFVKRYTEKVLKAPTPQPDMLYGIAPQPDGYKGVYTTKTADLGFFGFNYEIREKGPLVNRKPVCLVFGRETSAGAGCKGVESEQECTDMFDFYNLLSKDFNTPNPVYDEQTKVCIF